MIKNLKINEKKLKESYELNEKFQIIRSSKIKNIMVAVGYTIMNGIALNDLRNDPSTLNFVDCCITSLLTNLSYIWVINDNYRLNDEEKQLKLIKIIQNIEE